MQRPAPPRMATVDDISSWAHLAPNTAVSFAKLPEQCKLRELAEEARLAGEPEAEAAAAATFAAVDADNLGKLGLEELLSALAAAGDVADRAEVEALFKRLDVNGDGAITMEEWRAGHSGGGLHGPGGLLQARLDAAMKRGQLSLPPPDEGGAPSPKGVSLVWALTVDLANDDLSPIKTERFGY